MNDIYKGEDLYTQCLKVLGRDMVSNSFRSPDH